MNYHNFRKHMKKIHEGEKPNNCPMCEDSFAMKEELKAHICLAISCTV